MHHAVSFHWPSLTTVALWAAIIAAGAALIIIPFTRKSKKERDAAEKVQCDTLETNAWLRKTNLLNVSVQKFIKFTDLFGKAKDE
jgi:hypothetical protein